MKKVGVNDRQRDQRDAKARKSEELRKRRNHDSGVKGTADWATVTPDLLVRAIATVAVMGGALRLGYTRDGGAFAIGIYGDGEPFTEYVSPNEDMDEWLKGLIDDYAK